MNISTNLNLYISQFFSKFERHKKNYFVDKKKDRFLFIRFILNSKLFDLFISLIDQENNNNYKKMQFIAKFGSERQKKGEI